MLLSELPPDLVNFNVVGRNLMVHHYPGGIGFFSERIDYYRGFWSMRCLDDYYLGPDSQTPAFGYGNIQTVGPSSGYPLGAGGMIATAKFAGWGAGHKQIMSSTFGHAQWLRMNGQDPPVSHEHGRPRPDGDRRLWLPGRADHLRPPSQRLRGRRRRGAEAVARSSPRWAPSRRETVIPFAASTSIPQPGPGGAGQRGPGRSAPDPIGGLVNHQMGTMRMGATRTRASSIPTSASTGSPTCTRSTGRCSRPPAATTRR